MVVVVPVPVVVVDVLDVDVVAVVVELALDEDGAGVLVPASLPLVTTNVTARIRAPMAAMIAGRGSSIRGAFGTGSGRHAAVLLRLLRIRHVVLNALAEAYP